MDTAFGPESDSARKRSGRRPLGGRTAGSSLGETSPQAAHMQSWTISIGAATAAVLSASCQWGQSRWALLLMVCWTWRGTCRNGYPTVTTRIITGTVPARIPKVRAPKFAANVPFGAEVLFQTDITRERQFAMIGYRATTPSATVLLDSAVAGRPQQESDHAPVAILSMSLFRFSRLVSEEDLDATH